jgi:hypothetical protein
LTDRAAISRRPDKGARWRIWSSHLLTARSRDCGSSQLRARRYVDNYDFAAPRAREAIGPTICALREFLAVRHREDVQRGANGRRWR